MRQHPEQKLQESIKQFLDINIKPDLIWYAVPNGGLRNPVVAAKLKAAGVLPGVPDLHFVLDDGKSAYLELKSSKGRLSEEQVGFGVKVMALGHRWAMARDLDEAIKIFKAWNILKKEVIT